jgi:hypothetical protein
MKYKYKNKYKKQVATSALALSLFIGGSSIFAMTPEDLGVKNFQFTYQKQNKERKNAKLKKQDKIVGAVSVVNGSGFVLDVKNMKRRMTSSADVKTNASTIYTKNGLDAKISDLSTGQKVIVIGSLDQPANIITAKKVRMVA